MSDAPATEPARLPADPARPSLGLIWAESVGGVIGKDGGMPWHVPEDLAHFKEVTLGTPVIMGRRTWDSLQPKFRPLPGRRNIVITRDETWQEEGAEVAHSLADAIALAAGAAWVIGGAQVYRESISLADRLEVTEINARYEGDAHAPDIDASWIATAVEPASGWLTSRTGIEYRFLGYERTP